LKCKSLYVVFNKVFTDQGIKECKKDTLLITLLSAVYSIHYKAKCVTFHVGTWHKDLDSAQGLGTWTGTQMDETWLHPWCILNFSCHCWGSN